jgi:hypothetical protein
LKKTSAFIICLPIAMICSSCVTVKTAPQRGDEEVQPIVPMSKPRMPKTGAVSGVLMAYALRGGTDVVSGEGCRLRVENLTTKKHYFLTIKPRTSAVFSPLEPGSYSMRRLGCGLTKVWDVSDVASFKVAEGKVSYLGKFAFLFGADDLGEIKKVSRLENAEALVSALEQVPAASRESLVSGYTEKPITPSMREGDLRDGFDLFAQGTADAAEVLAPLSDRLKACATEASRTDPLRIGALKLVTVYKDGHFVEFKEKGGENAMADGFIACIERAHREFAPSEKGNLEIRTRL